MLVIGALKCVASSGGGYRDFADPGRPAPWIRVQALLEPWADATRRRVQLGSGEGLVGCK